MKFKKIFLLTPILASSLIIGCNTNKNILTGPKSRITIAFNAGDYTFKENKSHILPITISNGVDWTFLTKNLNEDLINGTRDCIDYPANVTFNHWKLNGTNIDTISPVPKFTTDGITLEADYTVNYSVTLNVGSQHRIKDKDDTGAATATSKTYTVSKDSTYAALKTAKEFKVYNADGTTEADDFKFFIDSTGVSITTGSEENYKFVRNNEVLTASYAASEKTNSFTGDDWGVFCTAAEQGLEYISTTPHGTTTNGGNGGYKEEYIATEFTVTLATGVVKTYTKEANTFVGLKRIVNLGSEEKPVEYLVTVVGEDQDYSGNQKCVFTFLFDNLISNNRSFGSSGSSNNYDASAINTYLNNQFYYSLPLSLRDHLLDVNKFTNVGGGLDTNKHIVQTTEKTTGTTDKRHKLFIPSLAEMNITQYKDGYHIYDPSGTPIKNVEAEGLGPQHEYNSCYAGLKNATTADRIKKPIIVNETTGEYMEGEPASYWLRSPDLATSHFTWTINESGDIDDVTTDITKCRGVCPGFCVGAEKSSVKVTFDLNGGTWKDGSTGSIDINVDNETTTMANVISKIPSAKVDPKGPSSTPNFTGWYNKASGGTIIDTTVFVASSTTVYANYTASTIYTFTSSNDKYEVTPVQFIKDSQATIELKATKTFTDSDGNIHKMHTLPKSSQVTLKRGTTTLTSGTHYNYNESNGEIVVYEKQTTGNITVTVNFSNINADWSVINEICKKDEDNQISKTEGSGVAGYIVKQYFDYGDTKTLTINSKDYKVQVIDIAHTGDTFTSGSNTVTAGLTFDFVYVPNEAGSFSDAKKGNQRYDYYNTSTPSNVYTKCTALYNSSTEIKSYVKTVTKNYMKDNGQWSKPVLGSLSCNFFIPSVIEYGFSNDFWSCDDKAILNALQKQEGSVYHLYNNIYNTDRSEMKKYSIKNTSTPISYWTRSCVYDYDNSRNECLFHSQMFYSGSTSSLYRGRSWDKAAGDLYPSAYYAPAFCI